MKSDFEQQQKRPLRRGGITDMQILLIIGMVLCGVVVLVAAIRGLYYAVAEGSDFLFEEAFAFGFLVVIETIM